jgi:hypothetical protein
MVERHRYPTDAMAAAARRRVEEHKLDGSGWPSLSTDASNEAPVAAQIQKVAPAERRRRRSGTCGPEQGPTGRFDACDGHRNGVAGAAPTHRAAAFACLVRADGSIAEFPSHPDGYADFEAAAGLTTG